MATTVVEEEVQKQDEEQVVIKHRTTVTHEDVPILLKRHHIIHGYRPLHQPNSYYFKSAFCSHNEVINVWTHFVPALVLFFCYMVPEWRSDTTRIPVMILYLGNLALLLGSSFAHLFHSRSPLDHIFWFLIDFSGIALFGIGIGLQRFACNDDMTVFGRFTYMFSLMAVVLGLQYSSTCYLFVCKPHWPYRLEMRMITCLFLAVWLYIPLYGRYMESSDDDETLSLHTKAFLWLCYSGIFMGAHVPERFAPGIFDILGYGHQLFHLCINMVAWNLCEAAKQDCPATPNSWSDPWNIISSFVFGASVVFICYTVSVLYDKAKELKYD